MLSRSKRPSNAFANKSKMSNDPGQLVILSGPSGVGKSSVLKGLLDRFSDRLTLSVSATTRQPRPGEQHGRDYFFLDKDEFQRRRAAGEFLECFEVFGRGHWYGTLISEVTPSLDSGKWVILEIDVDGTRAVLDKFPQVITIFVRPSNEEELERRLRDRATDSEEAIERRLQVARRELQMAPMYRYQIVNDHGQLDRAIEEISDLLVQHGINKP